MSFFDRMASHYKDREAASNFDERLEVFLRVARQRRSSSIQRPLCIDLGCGPGALTIAVARLGYRTIGVDASERMIELAQTAAASARVDIEFVNRDIAEFLATTDAEADLIISSSVLEYIPRPDQVVRDAAMRLRPGGYLVFSVPNRASIGRMVQRFLLLRVPPYDRYTSHWKNGQSAGALARCAATAGLELVRIEHFSAFTVKGRRLLPAHTRRRLVGTLTAAVLRAPSE